MSLFRSLTSEHHLLREIGRRIERALETSDEREGRREARNLLLVLLHALEGHERFEDFVFRRPLGSSSEPGRKALEAIARQHSAIEKLRWEVESILHDGAEYDLRTLRPLAERLIRMLDRHFESEESELWPQLNAIESRTARARADHEAAARLKELQKELAGYWSAVNEYLASDS